MITHDELMKQYEEQELTHGEKNLLKKLEDLTDKNIKERFDGSSAVYIDSSLIDDILRNVQDAGHATRRRIIKDMWINMYCQEGGWNIRYSSGDRDGGCYVITPLSEKEKIVMRS